MAASDWDEIKGKQKSSTKTVKNIFLPSLSLSQPFRGARFQHCWKSHVPRDRGVWAKTRWYTLHPSEGSLPWHNLMANLAITADSQFPQMSQWLGTWASMHMHTHAALAQCTFWGDSVHISHRMASCPTLVSFACVCRHGSMYVFHGMLTGQVDLMASRQKSRLICLLHISTAQEEEVVRSGEKYQGSTCLQTTILP